MGMGPGDETLGARHRAGPTNDGQIGDSQAPGTIGNMEANMTQGSTASVVLEDRSISCDRPAPALGQIGHLPSLTLFGKTRWLKRETVVKASRSALCLTIVLVLVSAGLNLYVLVRHRAQTRHFAWALGGVAASIAVPVSLCDIAMHMLHYVRPNLQKHYIRVMWMVPIYAIQAWLALRFKRQAMWLDALRECYEAYAIYSFFQLMLEYLGGTEGVQQILAERTARGMDGPPHMLFPLCKAQPWRYSTGQFLNNCAFGVWSYIVIRLSCAVVTLIIYAVEQAGGEGGAASHMEYITIILVNVGQMIALYCLIAFYHDFTQELAPIRAFSKFLAVKFVVFMAFWQGVLIWLLSHPKVQVITPEDNYKLADIKAGLQDFLLCFEMAIAAIGHHYVFSYHDFDAEIEANLNESFRRDMYKAVKEMMPVDLVGETNQRIRNIASTIHFTRLRVQPPLGGPTVKSIEEGAAKGECSIAADSKTEV